MKLISNEMIVARFVEKHGTRFDYSNVSYTRMHGKVKIICPVHGEFLQSPVNHLKGTGCPECAIPNIGKSRALCTSAWVEKAVAVHGGEYDYSKTEYVSTHRKVAIICRKHGEFLQTPANHLQGRGCPCCKVSKIIDKQRFSQETWVARAVEVHGAKYDYSRVVYAGATEKVVVVCPTHGAFLQVADAHLQGRGCLKCGRERIRTASTYTQSEWVEKATLVHGGYYNYSDSKYLGCFIKMAILCPKHGKFTQKPNDHLQGKGCPKCANQESKGEQQVADFVRSLGVETVLRDRVQISPLELDIYIPELNLAVEYCGSYYHSTLVLEDQNKHRRKFEACLGKGIHLVTLYESEWKTKPEVVKKVLKTLLGKTDSKTYARKLVCREVSITDARAFFETEHLQGAPRKGTFYGLYENKTLKACMGFAKGASLRGDTTTWELLRYASEGQVIGGASRLFRAFVKSHSPEKIVSFSDNRWFTGGMYETLGFVLDDENKPDYIVWSNKTGKVYHKSLFQRSSIPARINEFGSKETYDPATDPRTEREMTKLLNCGRIYDCGKKRWVWKRTLDPNPNK